MTTITDTNIKEKLIEVCAKFNIRGSMLECRMVDIGNIHHTFRATVESDGEVSEYIIQNVNTYVFKEPENIMRNITLITNHIRERIDRQGRSTVKNAVRFFETDEGKNFFYDSDGDFWRIMLCVPDSVTFNVSDDPDILRSAGEAFGEFQTLLSDFDASLLYETIPNFHNTAARLDTFFRDVERDPAGRVSEVKTEVDWFKSVREQASQLTNMQKDGKIPLRVTHNDTKVNNVLFDAETRRPLVVIDLDTVMPGLAMHDFGDAVRSAASTCDEDETDLDKVELDLGLYTAFAEGFIGKTAHSLTAEELDTMALGAFTIAAELASRFLDDYITGDKYFKTDYPKHNLDRARCQIKLAQDMLSKMDAMNKIVKDISARDLR